MAYQAAILGLSKIGASIGLALRRYPEELLVVGHDEDRSITKTAEKMGAVSKGFMSLHRCVRESKLIILALPLDDVRDALALIAKEAPEGAVVIDTSPNKTQVAEWTRELLAEDQYFTGWTLALNPENLHDPGLGVDSARVDLFANSLIGINDPPGTPEKVLSLSRNVVCLLDAKPLFIDSLEADGLLALGHELPRVAALALLLATGDTPGWHEGRKFAGSDYAKGSLPILSVNEREDLGLSLRLNRENMTRLIDDLIQALQRVKGHLESGDDEALREDLAHAIDQRLLWLAQRQKTSWGPAASSRRTGPKPSSFLGDWLGSRFSKGKKD